jgi:hypothetical protein
LELKLAIKIQPWLKITLQKIIYHATKKLTMGKTKRIKILNNRTKETSAMDNASIKI